MSTWHQTRNVAAALALAATLTTAHAAEIAKVPVEGHSPGRVAVYYFGNSLTGSTLPELHAGLGKSKGKEWVWDLMAVAGGQLWQYRDQFELDAKLGPVGDYTLDPELAKKAPWAAQKFLSGEWDAVVLQPFCAKLKLVQNEMWGKKYDTDRDFGDLAASKYLIDLALKKNPACRVYIYQDWPSLPLAGGAFGMAAEGVGKTGKELNAAQMLPVARSFDWPREWLRRAVAQLRRQPLRRAGQGVSEAVGGGTAADDPGGRHLQCARPQDASGVGSRGAEHRRILHGQPSSPRGDAGLHVRGGVLRDAVRRQAARAGLHPVQRRGEFWQGLGQRQGRAQRLRDPTRDHPGTRRRRQ
jgi:hypothetical protein